MFDILAKFLNELLASGQLRESGVVDSLESLAESLADPEDRDFLRGELALRLVQEGRIDRAEQLVGKVVNPHEEAHYWCKLASALSPEKESGHVFAALQNAEEAINKLPKNHLWERGEVLAKIAELLDRSGSKEAASQKWQSALAVARHGESNLDSECAAVLVNTVSVLAKTGRIELANEVAGAMSSPSRRKQAQELISRSSS